MLKILQNKKIQTLFIITIFCFVFFGGMVYADTNSGLAPYQPLAPITIGGEAMNTTLGGYLQSIFKFAIAISGVIAIFMIVLGGLQYMSTDAISGKKDGRKKINDAIIGLLLVLVSWLILKTINPKLIEFNFSPNTITSSSTNTNGSSTPAYQGTNQCTVTVNFIDPTMNGQRYKLDTSAGSSQSDAEGKVSYWENQHYTTIGNAPSGYRRNGCYKDSGNNWCVDIFAGDQSDMRFIKSDCSAGGNYSTCQDKKVLWEKTYRPFSASYRCSYK